MNDYRALTENEINVLENNSCWAEDWTRVSVAENFRPNYFHRVMFYGDICLGNFEKNVEVSSGFVKHSGINNATLRNATVGDNCLIENISGFINNYTIGNDCYISNVCTMETTEGATYGEGNLISVLNEVGDGNLILFKDINSQFADFMVKHFGNKPLKDAIRRLINEEIERTKPEKGYHWQRGEDCEHERDHQHYYLRRMRNLRSFTPQRLHHQLVAYQHGIHRNGGYLRKLYHL